MEGNEREEKKIQGELMEPRGWIERSEGGKGMVR